MSLQIYILIVVIVFILIIIKSYGPQMMFGPQITVRNEESEESIEKENTGRIYQQGEQFPLGSDKLVLPNILLFSIHMGTIKYGFTQLTLESMKWNPQVHFVLIQIVDGMAEANLIVQLANYTNVPNFSIKILTMEEWRIKVLERLGIDVPWDKSWFYKLCDYKPVLARMFPEYVNVSMISSKPEERFYKYWGYADMDVIWGSFQKYAHWFQGDFPFVLTMWFGTSGTAAFYQNEPWTHDLFLTDKRYLELLKDKEYHNLDEDGTLTDRKFVVDDGIHSIQSIQGNWLSTHDRKANMGKMERDSCFIESGDSTDWAGPVIWSHGRLRIVKGSRHFPPGRELLYYHRPDPFISLSRNDHINQQILRDMADYGFILPNWVPLMTRFVCSNVIHTKFHPYTTECLYDTDYQTRRD